MGFLIFISWLYRWTGWVSEWVGKPFCCSFAHVYPRVAPSMYESAIRITRGQFSLLHSPPNLGHITSNCPTRLCLPFLLNLPSSFVSLSSFSHSCFTYSNTILKLNLKKISMHLVQYCSFWITIKNIWEKISICFLSTYMHLYVCDNILLNIDIWIYLYHCDG